MTNLILTICSNNKAFVEKAPRPAKGEVTEYNGAQAITALLPEMAGEIYAARKKAFRRIKEFGAKRDGISLSDMPYNKDLKKGMDIVGNNSWEQGGFYMPAQQRYIGRFYQAFQNTIDHSLAKPCLGEKSGNYMLIVSGLYGVLTPDELIQGYSCNVQDDMSIRKCWKYGKESKGGLLTRILIAFIEKFKVDRVFDMMADDAYRHLVEWVSIASNCEVFYSHSRQQKGADMLMNLGRTADRLLSGQTEKNLSSIVDGDTVGEIEFNTTPPEWIPCGAISQRWTSFAAWAVSMTTNIEIFLDKAGVAVKDNQHGIDLFRSIDGLGARKPTIAASHVIAAMHNVRKFRNAVIHENHTPPDTDDGQDEVRRICERYRSIEKWAVKNGYHNHPKLKDVDY